LKALMRLVPRSSGRLTLGDVDISRVPVRDMVRLGIGYVPEGRHVFPGLTVENNLLLGAYTANWRTHTREPLNDVRDLPEPQVEHAITIVIDAVGCAPLQ
jgi:branched-chain amino acid transport system ATP-binding protein